MVYKEFDHPNLRTLDDFEWLAVATDSPDAQTLERSEPDRLASIAARVASGRPLLFLLHEPKTPTRIRQLVLFVPENKVALAEGLVAGRWEGDVQLGPPNPVSQDSPVYCQVLHFGPDLPDGPDGVAEETVSRIFSRFLISGRPLRGYSCTFFLPLDLRLDGELEQSDLDWLSLQEDMKIERYRIKPPPVLLAEYQQGRVGIPDPEAAHTQAYEFFYTHLQRQLFETEPANGQQDSGADSPVRPIVHWRLRPEELDGYRLELVEDSDREEPRVISAAVEDVSLYRYYNGILLLGIRVGLPGDLPQGGNEESDWWRDLVFSGDADWEAIRARQAEDWLRYTKTSRLLFASFHEQRQEGKIAPQRLRRNGSLLVERGIDDEFSPIITHFLRCFLPRLPENQLRRDARLRQVADDRLFVHVAYALSGPTPLPDTPEMAEFERLFSYALYVDQRSDGAHTPDGWAYDQTYTRELMQRDTLRRWQGASSLSGYTNAATVFMGFRDFFRDPIAKVHVPYLYAKIQIQVLLFRTTLELFERRIGAATKRLVEKGHRTRAFRNLRKDFIEFTNVYWFRHLSPQVQGEEVSSRMMEGQDLEGIYARIKDEMERADEYVSTERDFWFQDRADKAGWIAGILAVAALLLTCLDLFVDGTPLKISAILVLSVALVLTACVALFKKSGIGKKDRDHE